MVKKGQFAHFHPSDEENACLCMNFETGEVRVLCFYLIQTLDENAICRQEESGHRSPNPLLFSTRRTGDKMISKNEYSPSAKLWVNHYGYMEQKLFLAKYT